MSEKTKIQISNMDLHYGNFHALKNINMEIPEGNNRIYRPQRLWKIYVVKVPEQDE